MLLTRDNKNSSSTNLLKSFSNPLKSPTYMPPLRGLDKSNKQFYSPMEPNYPKNLLSFQTLSSSVKDLGINRIKVPIMI